MAKKINKKMDGIKLLVASIVVIVALALTSYISLTGFAVKGENIIEETLNITIPEGMVCKNFTEQVFWSSGYGQNPQGSIEYHTWYPNITDCTSCILKDIEIKTRFIYTAGDETTTERESYVQISNPDDSIFNNPKQGTYSQYLAYENMKKEEIKLKNYCGKNSNIKCEEESTGDYGNAFCYGIKIHAPQYSIIDVFEIKYKWCSNE